MKISFPIANDKIPQENLITQKEDKDKIPRIKVLCIPQVSVIHVTAGRSYYHH